MNKLGNITFSRDDLIRMILLDTQNLHRGMIDTTSHGRQLEEKNNEELQEMYSELQEMKKTQLASSQDFSNRINAILD